MSLVTFENLKRFFEGLKTKPLVFSGDINFNGATKYKNNELATKTDILTKTSQLTNDSGYLTKADLANTYLGKSDNAVSATKLQTARKINGVAFDGTADITILNGISDIYTFTKTLTLTTDWQDSGIHGSPTSTGYDLPSGSYIVQVSGMNSSATNLYNEIFTGLMSFYEFETNSENADEIILHKAGHAPNTTTIYLRTLRHDRASKIGLTLQIKANANLKESPYTFKFRKLI